MLPLGLVLLPGALLWRAGRWVVRAGGVTRLRYVAWAALALAVPYALVAWALALASRSAQAAPSAAQAAGLRIPARPGRRRPRRRAGHGAVAEAHRAAPGPAALA